MLCSGGCSSHFVVPKTIRLFSNPGLSARRTLLRQMVKIYAAPSPLLAGCGTVGGVGKGNRSKSCASINAIARKRELERIALENKHLVRTPAARAFGS